MIREEETIKVGKFQKTHALKGELNAILDIDPECFVEGKPLIVQIDGILVPFFLDSIRNKGTVSYLIKIEGIDSEEDARGFVNKDILLLKKDAEEYQISTDVDEDFIGFTIIDEKTGKIIGTIENVDDSTDNVLFIVNADKEFPLYIPAVDDFVSNIDEDEQKLYMKLPEGLIEMNELE